MRSHTVGTIIASTLFTALTATVEAQDATPVGKRLSKLEAELSTLRRELSGARDEAAQQRQAITQMRKNDDEATEHDMGFQLQLRFEGYALAHNRRNDFFSQANAVGGSILGVGDAGNASKADDEQRGLGIGIGLRLPVWLNILDGVDLLGALDIVYRQNLNQPRTRSLVTGERATSSYVNIVTGPHIRFAISDVLRPFVALGLNIQVQTPPTDGVTYLDLGLTAGAGLDVRVTHKISIGFDFKYTWMGAGDQEESDYGGLGLFTAVNF